MGKCPHCNLILETIENPKNRANHVRWCLLNPKRKEYSLQLAEFRKSIKHQGENQYTKAKKEGRSIEISQETRNKMGETWIGKHHSKKTKEHLSEKALSNPYRRKCKSTVFYNGFRFDSTWEVKVAQILDKNSIKWIQPDPIKWVDKTGREHNYFPDFYLVDYDIYLDPKNDYCIRVQKEKLDYIQEHHPNVHILNSNQLKEKEILRILVP